MALQNIISSTTDQSRVTDLLGYQLGVCVLAHSMVHNIKYGRIHVALNKYYRMCGFKMLMCLVGWFFQLLC